MHVRRHYFHEKSSFKGRDNYDQLVKIAMVMGTDNLEKYLKKYRLKLDRRFNDTLGKHKKKEWLSFATTENARFVSDLSLDWLEVVAIRSIRENDSTGSHEASFY